MDNIKLVITDVDGSLTDGGVYYFEDGTRARKFSTFDGVGFRLLKENNINVIMLSSSNESEIIHRANWLEVPFFGGILDKGEWLLERFALGFPSPENIAVFGNDIIDLSIMKLCGFVGCPADTHSLVIDHCYSRQFHDTGYLCSRSGGNGAFREFVDFIL